MTTQPEQPLHRSPRFVRFIFGRSGDYVWELRYQFLICLVLFVSSLTMGFYLGNSLSVTLLEELMGQLPDLESMSYPMIFLFIVGNNIFKGFLWMLLGLIFGIPPLLFVAINGFVVGWVAYDVSIKNSLNFAIVALTPHGVIEIPTFLICMAAGMRLGYQLINTLRHRGSLKAELVRALRLFVMRAIPLLLLAAVIEVTITPLLLLLLHLIPVPTL